MGLALPEPAAPLAAYVPFVRAGRAPARLGPDRPRRRRRHPRASSAHDMAAEAGAAAARTCALAAPRPGRGRLRRRLDAAGAGGEAHAASWPRAPGFFDQPKVVNGASELIVEVLGDAGRHARSAVGVAALPLGVAVEVEGVFELA